VGDAVLNTKDTGLEVVDVLDDSAFLQRGSHVRDAAKQMEYMRRLAQAFAETPDSVLQELVNVAVDICGADSAGISIQKHDENGALFYHWVATAGKYAHFLNAMLPPYPSACGLCLERNRPQLFRVSKPFFDSVGVEAEVVTDGLLLPWQAQEIRGTIWIMAHGRHEAFDNDDCRMMEVLAGFVAVGVRQQRQQLLLMEQARTAAAAAMANDLAHQINNPLQGLTNLIYLATEEQSAMDAKTLARQMSNDVERLSALVKKLLTLPSDMTHRG
jgi:two-component sensor histidine kinase